MRLGAAVFVRADSQLDIVQTLLHGLRDDGPRIRRNGGRVAQQGRAAEFAGAFVGGKALRVVLLERHPGLGDVEQVAL